MNSTRIYHALITSPTSTVQYELIFSSTPSLREVLQVLHERAIKKQPDALTIIVNIVKQAHVGGQEEHSLNESEIFQHSMGKCRLRIYCPEVLDSPQDPTVL
jgi:hypothetical protein